MHLVLAVWFYSWAGLLIGLVSGVRPPLNQLLMCAPPFTTEHYWFIDVYLILSLLTPFINKAIADIDQKGCKSILLVSLIGFSVLPSFMPFSSEIFLYIAALICLVRYSLLNWRLSANLQPLGETLEQKTHLRFHWSVIHYLYC